MSGEVVRSAQRCARRTQLVQGRQGVPGELVLGVTVTLGPFGVPPLEGEDAQLARESRGRIGYAACDQGGCHRGREADALEGVALLKLGTRRDGRLQARG